MSAPGETDRTYIVEDSRAGERVDRIAVAEWPDLSRSRLAQLIDEGRLQVDDRNTKPSARLKAGARLQLSVPAPVSAIPQAEAIDVPVLYEDSDLIVVNKPSGLVVHPAAGVPSGTLVNALLHSVRDLAGIGGEMRPGIVHRLDRDTSGAMVVAKNELALRGLQKAFHRREVFKQYAALCHGVPAAQGTFDTPFGRHPVHRVRMTSRVHDGPGVRRAVTHFEVSEAFGGDAARLQIRLETGRTHQIRVHFGEAGFPLLADKVYFGTKRDARAPAFVREAAIAIGRQALHAQVLAFTHPCRAIEVRCEAPLPPDFTAALERLRAGD